ncbi:MAG TPA: hypothetical protein VMU95_02330 [Trebonia sp.]|nr:hypothetical protein [Trebonia sp.]
MGFWGTYIVARAGTPITELAALAPSAGQVVWQGTGSDGWQAVQIGNGPHGWDRATLPAPWEATLRALMDQSGHPVIATTILDSDCGQLIGYSQEAGRWGGWLRLKMAITAIDQTLSQGDEGMLWWDQDGHVHAMDEEITSEKRARYQQRYDAALARFLEAGPDAKGATPLAVSWAQEAGLRPDPAGVLAALSGQEVFAEEQFFRLLTALGVPEITAAGPPE